MKPTIFLPFLALTVFLHSYAQKSPSVSKLKSNNAVKHDVSKTLASIHAATEATTKNQLKDTTVRNRVSPPEEEEDAALPLP